MGIYDRDYYTQDPPQGFSPHAPRTMVGLIILVNVAVWLADFLLNAVMPERGYWLSDTLAVHPDTIAKPWLWWQFLTAGFTHSPSQFQHILGNMLVLFFLGRDVERAYGPREFLRLYLTMVVLASIVWSAMNIHSTNTEAYGASGAVTGVVILFALNFPRVTLLLFFVLPVPAWLVGVLYIGLDMFGALSDRLGENIAFSMHLTGAAFAFLYYQRGWNLTRLTEGWGEWISFRRKPKLRVHMPDESESPPDDLRAEVDRILEKIYRDGESSLTPKERKTLETASREFQRNRTGNRR